MQVKEQETIQLTHRQHLAIHDNPEKAARAVDLKYVTDADAGITRLKKGNSFSYSYKSKAYKDKQDLDRIRKLVIPPAWTKVWICPDPNGHLQATGLDAMGRKQYKYHPFWQKLRNETKFHRLREFGKALPGMRKKIEKDICVKELNERKVLATIVSLIERTYIRVGNESY